MSSVHLAESNTSQNDFTEKVIQEVLMRLTHEHNNLLLDYDDVSEYIEQIRSWLKEKNYYRPRTEYLLDELYNTKCIIKKIVNTIKTKENVPNDLVNQYKSMMMLSQSQESNLGISPRTELELEYKSVKIGPKEDNETDLDRFIQ